MGKSCRITGVVHLPPFGVDRIHVEGLECWLLIILAKIIMTPLLQRDETYYDDPKGGEDDE